MLKYSVIAAALFAVGLSAAPTFAASNGVPFCTAARTEREQHEVLNQLSQELHLSSKQGGTIEYWNGCLKVSYTEDGHSVTYFYDPSSFRQGGTLN